MRLACGLMSRIAAKPSAFATWSPSRASLQKRQSSGSEDPLLHDRCAADRHELAHRRVDEPGRVVGAVAAARPVDENDVLPADLRRPAGAAGPSESARNRALRSFFTSGGTGSSARGARARARRVREHVHLRQPRGAHGLERALEGGARPRPGNRRSHQR